MIVFVGAVRHPLNSNNYSDVERLLYETLISVCKQTDENYRVVVVCNQAPQIENPVIRQHVEFITVDFSPPSRIRGPATGMDAIRKDRSTKYIVGLLAAQKYQPDYIMIFDVDDYVSPEIAKYVNTIEEVKNGWFVEQGFVMDHNADKRIWPINDFHQLCGTSLIINNELLINPVAQGSVEIETMKGDKICIDRGRTRFSRELTISSSQEEILSKVDKGFLDYIIGSHRYAADYFKLEPLPFPGAVWNWNTGENHGGNQRR